jgi:hypothetical protein
MRKAFVITAIGLIILSGLYLGKDVIVKQALSQGLKALTGVKLNIETMNVGIANTSIAIKGIKMYNPGGFKDKLMADIPEIYADYCFASLWRGKLHFARLRLDLKELTVVKNKDGEINLKRLKTVRAKKEEAPAQKAERPKKSRLQVDVLELKVDKVIYKDYSKGTPPKLRVYNVNIDERYENIDNLKGLTNLILVKALVNTTITDIANLDIAALKDDVSKMLSKTAKKAKHTAGRAVETGKGIVIKTKNITQDALKKTTQMLKGIFSLEQ